MGRNEEEWLRNKRDCLKKLEDIIDSITTSDAAEVTTSSDISHISLMLSRIADALEEMNEKLNKKTVVTYDFYGANNRKIASFDSCTDDCK